MLILLQCSHPKHLKNRQLAGKGNQPEEPDLVAFAQQSVQRALEEFWCLPIGQKDSVSLHYERSSHQ